MKTIQLKPSCKDYLWGGEKLRTEYGIQSEMHPLSEAWMLSCHPDGPSYLPDGTTLQQYIDAHPGCLGTDCVKFEEFPILAKLIDAKKDLSIQVHPSNAYALEHEHQQQAACVRSHPEPAGCGAGGACRLHPCGHNRKCGR